MKKMAKAMAKKGMKKSMAKKAMKSMKKRAMKKSAKSYKTVAGANRAVFYGKISKTKGGKIVSSKKSALGKKNKWIAAVNKARKALGVKGFVVIKKGSALYKKAKSLYK